MKPNKDFFIECNEGGMMSPPEFERTFCSQCKNRQCVRASWAFSNWDKRILTQVDRLLTNPNIVLQNESSRWDGVLDFELFNEPQVIEVWGIPESPIQAEELIREEPDTIPVPPIDPPEFDENILVAEKPEPEPEPEPDQPKKYTNPLNTPPQEITIGEVPKTVSNPKPKNFKSDPWSVTETLPVGGKFKMGK